MKKPFFSIIIPTKNRSSIVGNAIASLQMQIFDDIEIIVVDNDDTEKTAKAVSKIDDSRIIHFRTGNLSMPDNWEFGTTKCRGEYMLFLEDKQVLKTYALEKVFDAVNNGNHRIVSWLMDYFAHGKVVKNPDCLPDGSARELESDQIFSDFVNFKIRCVGDAFPRGINSCLHRGLSEKIHRGPFSRLCLSFAPDLTMGFQQLNIEDRFFHISEPLVTSDANERFSNGMSIIQKGELFQKFMSQIGWDVDDYHKYVPLKIRTFPNINLNDYFHLASVLGGSMGRHKLNIPKYFAYIYFDIIETSGNLLIDMSEEMALWHKALNERNSEFRKDVLDELEKFKQIRQIFKRPITIGDKCKTIGKILGLDHVWRSMKGTNQDPEVYKDMLDYISQTKY